MFFDNSSWAGKAVDSDLPKCGACGLYKQCRSPKMLPTRGLSRRVLFVGEAPGEQEGTAGTQLVGPAGQCLRRMLASVDADLEEHDRTNAVICRPPDNLMDKNYVECCRPNLLNTIRELRPNVIVLMGMTAVQSLISTEWGGNMTSVGDSLAKWIGWTIPSQRYNAWLCPTYHPSYVLRMREDPLLVKLTSGHLRRALALADVPVPVTDVEAVMDRVELIPDPRLMRARMRDLAAKAGRLAFDYETTGLKPERPEQEIYTASFCLEGEDLFAGRIDANNHRALSRVLANDKLLKIGSNIKFEDRWTRCKLGHPVAAWLHDTMLGAHVIDNRGDITSIKMQTYLNRGVGDYNQWAEPYLKAKRANELNRIKEAPLGDVLKYNGGDSYFEFIEAVRQMEMPGVRLRRQPV